MRPKPNARHRYTELPPIVSIPIVVSTASRLAVVPALAFFVFPLAGVTGEAMSDSTVALAMLCGLMLIILSGPIQDCGEGERLGFGGYLLSAVSMTSVVLLIP